MRSEFLLPFLVIDSQNLDDAFVLHVQFGKIEIVWAGQPANGRFDCATGLLTAVDDPFEDAHIVAKTGPEKLPVHAFAEPVHVKDERRIGEARSDVEPVPKIIADVVSAEWKHCHRVAPHLT